MKKQFKLEGDKQFRFDASKAAAQIDGSLIIEGWVSTPDLDDGMDIVEPTAFTKAVIDEYMQKPIVLFMHRYHDLPVGKTLALHVVPDKGLWASIQLLPTESMGRDLILLVKAGVVKSFSYSYRVKKFTVDEETGIRTIHEFSKLSEITVANLGMDFYATFEEAAKAGVEIKSKELIELARETLGDKYKSIGVQKGNNKLNEEEKKAMQEQLEKTQNQANTATAKISEVKNEVAEVSKLIIEMKEAQEKTDAEKTEFMTKMLSDFTTSHQALTEAIQKVSTSKTMFGSETEECPFDIKSLMSKPTVRLKRVFSESKFAQIEDVRRQNDMVLMIDAIKCAADENYRSNRKEDRIANLDSYKELKIMAKSAGVNMKAMDTSTSDEGSQFLPVGYSARMHEMVREELAVVNMHPSFPMIAASQVDPVEGSDTIATRATQKTTVVSAFNTTEQTPGSANKTFTAEKLRGRTQFSGEADEDLIISIFDYVERKVARSIARALEYAFISGDDAGATGLDSGDTPGSTDARYCWDGFRVATQSGNKVDLSTFSEKNLNLLRSKGGKYFKSPDQFYWLTSLVVYLLHFLDPDEMPSVHTIDKYGAQATVVTGELGKYGASPILTSEFVLNTYDATGVYSGAGQTRSIVQAVNREAFKLGVWKTVSIEVIRNALDDVYDIVGWWRGDMKCIYDETAEDVTATGYGVTTT